MPRRRPFTGRALVAVTVTLLLGANGVPTLLAAAPPPNQGGSPHHAAAAKSQGPVTPEMLETMRRGLLEQQRSTNPTLAARAKRMLLLHDIVAATDRAERHAKIRALPVTIVRSRSDEGAVAHFVANGKTRVRLVSPAAAADPGEARVPGSGPSVEAQEEQCYDGEPPCATDEEMEDTAIVLAAAAAEAEAYAQWYEAEVAAYDEFCQNNPWACEQRSSGPNAACGENCWNKAALAGVAVVANVVGIGQMQGQVQQAVATGWRLTRWGVGVMVGSAFVLGYAAGTAIDSAYVCFRYAQEPIATPLFAEPYEPASIFM